MNEHIIVAFDSPAAAVRSGEKPFYLQTPAFRRVRGEHLVRGFLIIDFLEDQVEPT